MRRRTKENLATLISESLPLGDNGGGDGASWSHQYLKSHTQYISEGECLCCPYHCHPRKIFK